MKPSLIDAHCHLDQEYIEEGIDELIGKCADEGVGSFIFPSATRSSNQYVLKTIDAYPQIFGLLGIHPHDAKEFDDSFITEIEQGISHAKVIGVGEIGLDFYYNHSPKSVQIEVFRRLLSFAKINDLPVQIHVRDAFEDCMSVLTESEVKGVRGLIHCFSGDSAMAKSFLDLGFNISFSGIVTFKNAKDVIKACEIVPIDRLHIETDTPYLAPHPKRGKQNRPYYLPYIANRVAEIKQLSLKDVAAYTTANTKKLFNMG